MADSLPLGSHITSMLSRSASSSSLSSLSCVRDEMTSSVADKGKDKETENVHDVEKGQEKVWTEEKKSSSNVQFLVWTFLNTFATICIVFTNKAIFADPTLRLNQSTFAAFHFSVTGATLYVASRPAIGIFTPVRAHFLKMLPLAMAMCLNVILPNLSLAFSSIAFYQIVRVLLTPLVAIINFMFYGTKIPRRAVYTLVPICMGVAMVSYYDTRPVKGARLKGHTAVTTSTGVFFAVSGVIASSMYTVWIGTYQKKFKMSSMQLLFNQAPISAFLLLYAIPFTDNTPRWSRIPENRWMMILLSGLMASIINISQFFLVANAGPVSSTVVGHLKTCSIVGLGWVLSGKKASDKGIFGILIAVSGIVAYSMIMYQYKLQQQSKS